ncbi:MAG: EamA family transporter [Bacteroidota bacterium]
MKNPRAIVLYVLLALVWGSSFILMKRGLESFSPLQIAGMRILIAGLVMVPFLIGKAKQMSRKDWIFVSLVGIFGNGLPAFLFPMAETHINSATAGILNSLSPLFTLVLGILFFQLPFSGMRTMGILLGFLGALILVLTGDTQLNLWEHLGYASLVVIGAAGYGLSTNLMKSFLHELPSLLASGFALLSVAIPYGLYVVFFSGVPQVLIEQDGAWLAFGHIVILGSIGTSLALIWYYRLLRMTDPITSSSVAYVIPVVALFWGLLDGEQMTSAQFGGMAVILVGVFLATRGANLKIGKPLVSKGR